MPGVSDAQVDEQTGGGTEGDAGGDENPFSAMDPAMAAAPQEMYGLMREMPAMPVEGVGVILSGRAEIDAAFRDPTTFSSDMSAVDL